MTETQKELQKIEKEKHRQIIKLVTHSFYKELVNYGVDQSDIINVSTQLLDHVLQKKPMNDNGTYQDDFDISKIDDHWHEEKKLILGDVHIQPLQATNVVRICEWLKQHEISQTFIRFFPQEKTKLEQYLLHHSNRQYFSVRYLGEHFVGIIGGENIDEQNKKLEMKKFIGASEFRNKGIGKLSTFLFLYYAFEILNFQKIYIHSLDTNIKNINLNSKFGFELEGILYSEVLIDGIAHDVLRMSLLRDKWLSLFGKKTAS
ncbi:MAG: N-acetyltransferase [Bacteroidetes bacterium]|nr:MAG: N-acetyltransferase [Bacteroidota bacterium]